MTTVDLDAPLIPGISAAGWRIGDRLLDRAELLWVARHFVYHPGFHLNDAIDANEGALIVRNFFPEGSGHTAVFFGAGVVKLAFNARGELFEVSVWEGYRGRAFDRIGLGSTVEEVRSLFPVYYDSGDEMYYPDEEQSADVPTGISFFASEAAQPGGTTILGMSVHDWSVMRRPRVVTAHDEGRMTRDE